MNKEQRRWAKRLQKCIDEMPSGIELLIEPFHTNHSTFLIMQEGKVQEMDEEDDDRMSVNFAEQALTAFTCQRVFSNSESI